MTTRPARLWRPLLVAAGAAMAAGGPLHPESDATDSLRQELATMTSGDTWVLSHSLLAAGALLLALGLWAAHRAGTWPSATRTALRGCAVAMSLYVVETVAHLVAAVDSDALAAGDPAPLAFSHVGLAVVLYPVSGLALAWLSSRLVRGSSLPGKVFGVIGVVAGLLHASSVPLTMIFPDAEISPVFAGAGLLLAAWSFGIGLAGLRAPVGRPATSGSVRIAA